LGQSVLAGVDLDAGALVHARQRRVHRHLVAASAGRMPFRSACFRTIVANSVLEHIPDLEAALGECCRLLEPGGRLLMTAPSHRFGDMLLGSTVCHRLGLSRLAAGYRRWFNARSRHFHTDSAEAWKSRLIRHGFRVERHGYYLTPRALRVFDLAHYLSLPRWACRKLTGSWVPLPGCTLNWLWERWLRPHCLDALRQEEGPYLLLEARKS